MLNWLKRVLGTPEETSSAPDDSAAPSASAGAVRESAPEPDSVLAPVARPRGRPRKTPLDEDGQPKMTVFNRARRSERSTSELIGMAKAVIVDRAVTHEEVSLLVSWLDANPEAAESYPGNVLARRLERILADDVVDDEELEDLAGMLAELTGASHGALVGANAATTLPLCRPQPELRFEGSLWVFTGKMAYGPRKVCEQEIQARGGSCASNITQKTSYLVIGTIGSRDWAHTSHGRKIEQAVGLRERGIPIAIIGENHWASALDR